MVVKSGTLETLEALNLAEVAKEMLCGDQTCALVSWKLDISVFGYNPTGVIVMGPAVRSTDAKSCKVWHMPPFRQ